MKTSHSEQDSNFSNKPVHSGPAQVTAGSIGSPAGYKFNNDKTVYSGALNAGYNAPLISAAGYEFSNEKIVLGAVHTLGFPGIEIASVMIDQIDLAESKNVCVIVSGSASIGSIIDNIANQRANFIIMPTITLTLTVNKENSSLKNASEDNLPSYSGLGDVTLYPKATLKCVSDIIIWGHEIIGDQSFTNNSDSNMKLGFNETLESFELQPIGEATDVV
jgi:hypothetical protein